MHEPIRWLPGTWHGSEVEKYLGCLKGGCPLSNKIAYTCLCGQEAYSPEYRRLSHKRFPIFSEMQRQHCTVNNCLSFCHFLLFPQPRKFKTSLGNCDHPNRASLSYPAFLSAGIQISPPPVGALVRAWCLFIPAACSLKNLIRDGRQDCLGSTVETRAIDLCYIQKACTYCFTSVIRFASSSSPPARSRLHLSGGSEAMSSDVACGNRAEAALTDWIQDDSRLHEVRHTCSCTANSRRPEDLMHLASQLIFQHTATLRKPKTRSIKRCKTSYARQGEFTSWFWRKT